MQPRRLATTSGRASPPTHERFVVVVLSQVASQVIDRPGAAACAAHDYLSRLQPLAAPPRPVTDGRDHGARAGVAASCWRVGVAWAAAGASTMGTAAASHKVHSRVRQFGGVFGFTRRRRHPRRPRLCHCRRPLAWHRQHGRASRQHRRFYRSPAAAAAASCCRSCPGCLCPRRRRPRQPPPPSSHRQPDLAAAADEQLSPPPTPPIPSLTM